MIEKPTIEALKEGGMLLIDKPYKWTSFDVVRKLRGMIKAKIGHAGTLDPLATGLLICCTGKFTRKINEYQKLPKEYTGIFQLGAVTETYDLEAEPKDFKPLDSLTDEDIRSTAQSFTGLVEQIPPIHSAIKKEGRRAYEIARKGEEIVLNARPVTIFEFECTKIQLPEVYFRVRCSTGTYIRSLAYDFGQKLGCGAYLQQLRRTKIGSFDVEDALEPREWEAVWFPQKKSPE